MKPEPIPNTSKLEQRLGFFNRLLSQIPDLIFQMTIDENGAIEFPFLSQSVMHFFELTTDEVKLNKFDLIKSKIYPDDLANFSATLQKAKSGLSNWQYEFRCFLPSKGLRWFRVRATIEKGQNGDFVFYGRINDSTDNRLQSLKLKISEERYEFALEASSEGIWDYDVVNNRVFFSSQSMKMLHLEEKDVVLSVESWDNRLHPDDKEKYKADINIHFEGKTPFYENLQRVLTEQNNYKWILSRGKVIERDSAGKPLRVIGTHTDVSVQIQKEQELKQTLEILEEQNKRLLNFAHIVSHNLRSHAGNFKMLLDIIDSETDPELRQESLGFMRVNSDGLNETIENLKELVDVHSHLKPIKEHLNLSAYLKNVMVLLSKEFAKNKVEFKIDVPDNETVYFNPAYLESILLNFSTNAVKYSQPDKNPIIDYKFSYENGQKTLSISDNGLGIDLKRHGDSIFGMYKTFHQHANSRGIGLFISKNQIEEMGGKVTVTSKVGVGSSFKIYFND